MDQIAKWDAEVYEIYPRKVGRRKAMTSIRHARTRLHDGIEVKGMAEWVECQRYLVEKTRQFANSPAGNRDTLTPHPTTFYNQSRYLDSEVEWYKLTPDEQKQQRRAFEANVGVSDWRPF
jgi:hypothetical protein